MPLEYPFALEYPLITLEYPLSTPSAPVGLPRGCWGCSAGRLASAPQRIPRRARAHDRQSARAPLRLFIPTVSTRIPNMRVLIPIISILIPNMRVLIPIISILVPLIGTSARHPTWRLQARALRLPSPPGLLPRRRA